MTHHLAIPTGLIWTDLQIRRRRTRLPGRIRAWANRYPSHDHTIRALRRYLKRYGKPSRIRWTLSRGVILSNKRKIADVYDAEKFNDLCFQMAGDVSEGASRVGVEHPTTDQILADWDKPQSLSPQEQDNVNQALSSWLKFISDNTPRRDCEVIQFTLSLCSGWKPAPRLELDRLMRRHTEGVLRSRAKGQAPQ